MTDWTSARGAYAPRRETRTTFDIRIVDDRAAAPETGVIIASSTTAAWVQAKRILASSPHNERVEVYEGGRLAFTVTRPPPEAVGDAA